MLVTIVLLSLFLQVITLVTLLKTRKPVVTLPQPLKRPTNEAKTSLLEYEPPENALELEQKRILNELNLR
jgi:hypothetical protein